MTATNQGMRIRTAFFAGAGVLAFAVALGASAPISAAPAQDTERVAVPSGEARATAAARVEEVYREAIRSARRPEEKAALGKKLMAVAQDTHDDPALRYGLQESHHVIRRFCRKVGPEIFAVQDPAALFVNDIKVISPL